jgi:hypothetical protein
MSLSYCIKNTLPRREKLFGHGRPLPLDRNAKARVMVYARALMRRTEKGRAYGEVTAKARRFAWRTSKRFDLPA